MMEAGAEIVAERWRLPEISESFAVAAKRPWVFDFLVFVSHFCLRSPEWAWCNKSMHCGVTMRYRWDACGPRVKSFFSYDLVDSLAECGWAIHLFCFMSGE